MIEPKKYQVIYADPPWKFSNNQDRAIKSSSSAMTPKYPCMKTQDIKDLPIKNIADKDCALFMWTTDTHLKQAIEIMEAWGFKYITVAFVWNKTSAEGKDWPFLSPWTLKQTEMCLFGTRGTMLKHKKDNKVRQFLSHPKTKHSQKPQEIADRIVRLFPDLNRIELFARDAKPGWDIWGNELPNTIEII